MLYHTSVGVPNQIRSQVRTTGLVVPVYSQHAQDAANQRSIDLPDLIDYTKCRPFEIETKRDGTIIKVAYRTSYPADTKRDLVLVIHPANNFVRTIWLNRIGDDHTSLDATKYEPAY